MRKYVIERNIPKVGSLERKQLREAAQKPNKALRKAPDQVTVVRDLPKPMRETHCTASLCLRLPGAGVPLLVGILVLAIACSKQKGEDYFPEPRDGEQWEYKVELLAPLLGVVQGKMLVRVDGKETIKGKDYFKFVNVLTGIPGVEPEVYYYRWAREGVYEIKEQEKKQTESRIVPFPVDVGATWKAFDKSCRVEAIETLELYDRKYEDCLKIVCEAPGSKWVSYTVRGGTGEVKGILHKKGGTMEWTLVSHKR